jgi:hypothetical protein
MSPKKSLPHFPKGFIIVRCIVLSISMEGRPIVPNLQYFVSCPLCCIVTPIGLITTCTEDVMYFILPNTYLRDLFRPMLEQISLNPSVGGTFPDDFATLFVGQMLREPPFH